MVFSAAGVFVCLAEPTIIIIIITYNFKREECQVGGEELEEEKDYNQNKSYDNF